MSAKFPRGGGAGPFLARSLNTSSKNNGVTEFNGRKRGFYLNKIIVFGVFLSQGLPWIMPSAKRK